MARGKSRLVADISPENPGPGNSSRYAVGVSTPATALGYPSVRPPRPGSVTLVSLGLNQVTATIDGPPIPATDADSGWDVVEREKRKPGMRHKASPLEAWTIPLVIASHLDPGPVPHLRIQTLERMRSKPSPTEDPPPVRVLGVGQIPASRDWLITQLEPAKTDDWRYRDDRLPRLAFYNVTVTERSLLSITRVKPAKATRTSRGVKGVRSVVARSGDTGHRIALRELGRADRWRELKVRRNGKYVALRDPDSLRSGTRVYINAKN